MNFIESDDFAFGREAADVESIPDFGDIAWDANPERILEERELDSGINCFGQPIN